MSHPFGFDYGDGNASHFLNGSGSFISASSVTLTGPISISGCLVTTGSNISIGGYTVSAVSTTTIPQMDGWIPANGMWSYGGTTVTITVPSGAASIYSVGDRIKIIQTTTKYFYVVSVADTTLTVTGGSDYNVANAAITGAYFSKSSSPVGFPQWFNHTVVTTGFSADPSISFKFCLTGRTCVCKVRDGSTGTSSQTYTTYSLPIQAANTQSQSGTTTSYVDAGVSKTGGWWIISANATVIDFYQANTAAWTNSGAKAPSYSNGNIIVYEV